MPISVFTPTVMSNLKVVSGQVTTVSASDTIQTGLSKVLYVVSDMDDAPVLACSWSSASVGDQAGSPASGSIKINTWKTTSSADATPVAATAFGKKVNFLALGY